jgi:hypothetical protein
MVPFRVNRRRSPFPTTSSSHRHLPVQRFSFDLLVSHSRHSSLTTRHFFLKSQISSLPIPFSVYPEPRRTTLAIPPQTTETKATLSPVFATLTRRVTPNPFVCHSYKKNTGGGVYPLLRDKKEKNESQIRNNQLRFRFHSLPALHHLGPPL